MSDNNLHRQMQGPPGSPTLHATAAQAAAVSSPVIPFPPIPPDISNIRQYPLEDDDPFERIHLLNPYFCSIVHTFWEANSRRLEDDALKEYIFSNLRPEILISGDAEKEIYLHHAVKEILENGKVECSPENMAPNSRIIYRIIGTQWLHTQAYIMCQFNVIRKELETQESTRQSRGMETRGHHQNINPGKKQNLFISLSRAPLQYTQSHRQHNLPLTKCLHHRLYHVHLSPSICTPEPHTQSRALPFTLEQPYPSSITIILSSASTSILPTAAITACCTSWTHSISMKTNCIVSSSANQ